MVVGEHIRMILRSTRWRLTLSFAAIALLTAVALGAVLLVILQRYYAQREVDYLNGNAQIISTTLGKMSSSDLPREALQLQVESLAFLSQTRVRVLDANNVVQYDSGEPHRVDVALGFAQQVMQDSGGLSGDQKREIKRIIAIGDGSMPLVAVSSTKKFDAAFPAPDAVLSPDDTAALKKMLADAGSIKGATVEIAEQKKAAATGDDTGAVPPGNVIFYRSIAVAGSPFGFYLNGEIRTDSPRSAQTVSTAYLDRNGKPQGTVELSDGPALGFDILSSVAAGWAAASGAGIVLAALVGWLISRRISAPVLALSEVTARLAGGDLSSRADASGRDEFGQLAQAFNHMADQVQTTVDALRRFVSDAAHELHSPLTALRTDLDLAADETDAVRRQQFVDRARTMVARLEGLTNNLLDLSRIEAKGSAKEYCFDLAALLREHCEAYASEAEQAGLGFELALPAGAVMIRAEPAQATRALGNLVDNACKFSPPGGLVRCALSRTAEHVIVSVSDSGIGIPAEDLPHLFNRFHRGRNAVSYPGSGLGLAIVKAIMEQQGGTVLAENVQGGARFALQWPPASCW